MLLETVVNLHFVLLLTLVVAMIERFFALVVGYPINFILLRLHTS